MEKVLSSLLLGVLLVPAAWAGPRLTHLVGTPAMQITSTYVETSFGNSDPVVFQVFTGGSGETVVLRGLTNSVGLAFVLVCPDGRTWRGGHPGGFARIAAKTVVHGWCTVSIAPSTGKGFSRNFRFSYHRVRP